jgi:Kinesin motor domain
MLPLKEFERDCSQVRVCVRVRPIAATERENGTVNVLKIPNTNTIQLSGRRFTFDSVFDDAVSQADLYQLVAPSLLQSYLDGFNATVRL